MLQPSDSVLFFSAMSPRFPRVRITRGGGGLACFNRHDTAADGHDTMVDDHDAVAGDSPSANTLQLTSPLRTIDRRIGGWILSAHPGRGGGVR